MPLPIKDKKKNYLIKLIDNLKEKQEQSVSVSFKIVETRQNGFIVKSNGLFAYVHYNYMPWKYKKKEYWKIIFPLLKGKILFGEVFSIKTNPISVQINGEIPQFKNMEFLFNHRYLGIVLDIEKNGILVEFGGCYNWNYGSMIGKIVFSYFESINNQSIYSVGSEIYTYYYKEVDSHHVFSTSPIIKSWENDSIERFRNKVLVSKVTYASQKNIVLKVAESYEAYIFTKKEYYLGFYGSFKKALKHLIKGDIITCEIIEINDVERSFGVIWKNEYEIKSIAKRSLLFKYSNSKKLRESRMIESRISTDVLKKLKSN